MKRDSAECPFCGAGRGRGLKVAVVAAAFFGSAAIAGCAYGPPPDDFQDATDAASDVQADAAQDGTSADAPDGEL